MDVFNYIWTRLLPKTGQTEVYSVGDDGTHEIGWWKNTDHTNNRTRFIALTLNHDAVVIDRATGLMWAADINSPGCNNNVQLNFIGSIVYGNGLVFAGFNDWRCPNVYELFSIKDHNSYNPQIYIDYFTCTSGNYGTSTTNPKYTDYRYHISFASGGIGDADKSYNRYFRAVRSL